MSNLNINKRKVLNQKMSMRGSMELTLSDGRGQEVAS